MLNKRLRAILGGLIIVGLLIISGCGVAEETEPETTEQGNTEQQADDNEQAEQTDEKAEPQADAEPNDSTIEVVAFEMGYKPSTITLQKDKEYELILTNDGNAFHDLTSKELDVEITYMSEMPDHPESTSFIETLLGVKKAFANGNDDHGHEKDMNAIHMNVEVGQTVSIKFIPKQAGEFKFYCTVPGHEAAGMYGTFIVE